MAKTKSNRIIAIIITLILGSCILYGISSILTYFKTGAKKINKYDAGVRLLDNHNPIVTWLSDAKDIGGTINPYLRKEIQEDYLDAWGILHLSLNNQKDLGLEENFSAQKARQIRSSIQGNFKVTKEDLKHHLKLHFLSYDKQVASLTDYGAVIRTSVITNNKTATYYDTSDIKIIMTLNDGKWRVDKFVRLSSKKQLPP